MQHGAGHRPAEILYDRAGCASRRISSSATTATSPSCWASRANARAPTRSDAFAARILHGLIHGMEPQRMVDFATAAACLEHSIPGDFHLSSVADIELLLSERPTDVRR
jgi:sugar/nucleoside kinase (ribokinase family)